MNLHRVETVGGEQVSDWELVSPEYRTVFQRIAASTEGIITPGNAITVLGKIIAIDGLRRYRNGSKKLGLLEFIGGASTDALDGLVADSTETKCPQGALLDLTSDKLLTLTTLCALSKNDGSRVVPKSVLSAIGAINGAITIYGISKKVSGEWSNLDPTAEGKAAAGVQWATLGLYGVSSALAQSGHEKTAKVTKVAAGIAAAGYVVSGLVAVQSYLHKEN